MAATAPKDSAREKEREGMIFKDGVWLEPDAAPAVTIGRAVRGLVSDRVQSVKGKQPADRLAELATAVKGIVEHEKNLKAAGFPPSIDPKLGSWFVTAVAAYQTGAAESLDKALGLKRGRGRPKAENPKSYGYTRAKHCYWVLMQAEEKTKALAELADTYGLHERTIQREVERYAPDILREATRELAELFPAQK